MRFQKTKLLQICCGAEQNRLKVGLSSPIRGPRRLFRRCARAETAPRRALGRGRPGSTASTPCIIRSQHFGLDVVKRSQPEVARTVNHESRSYLARHLNDALEPPEPFASRPRARSQKRSLARYYTVCVSNANTAARGGRNRQGRRRGCTLPSLESKIARDGRNLYKTHRTTGDLVMRTRGSLQGNIY